MLLQDYFVGHPLILVPLYYHCPDLCPIVLKSLAGALKRLSLTAGRDFEVVALSIDPREGAPLAQEAKSRALAEFGRPEAGSGWHFLTGDERAIAELAEAIGFRYVYDAVSDEYAHPSGLVILTGDGRIARYLYGASFAPRDLRLGLVEASAGRIGSPVDQFLLRCFHYDPTTGKYTFLILDRLRALTAATVIGVGGLIVFMLRAKRRRRAAGPRPRSTPVG